MGFLEQTSLIKAGVRRKMVISYALMAIIPILVLTYFLISYILPSSPPDVFHLSLILILTLWISVLGYSVLRQMIMPLIKLAEEARKLADGNYGFTISVDTEDEVGEIAGSVSSIKRRIENYVTELDSYSKRTSKLNHKMQRNLLTLTSLMNLADMIGSQMKFQQITDYAARKIAEEMKGGFCAIYVRGEDNEYALSSLVKGAEGDIGEDEIAVLLSGLDIGAGSVPFLEFSPESAETRALGKFKKVYPKAALLVHPLTRRGDIFGMIVAGIEGTEEFSIEDKEMIEAFGKELLLVSVRTSCAEMSSSQHANDICSMEYFIMRVQEELTKAALHQSVCSLMCIKAEGLSALICDNEGVEELRDLITGIISAFLPDDAESAVNEEGRILALVPGMDKKSVCELAEELSDHVRERELPAPGGSSHLELTIGVAEGTSDASEPGELIEKAALFMEVSRGAGESEQ